MNENSFHERDLDVLEHIQKYCLEIGDASTLFGVSFDVFLNSSVYRNSCTMCLLQIGELVGHLSDDFVKNNEYIPWHQIRATRNMAAHNYGRMSMERVWETIWEDIPILQAFCTEAIEVSRSSELEEEHER